MELKSRHKLLVVAIAILISMAMVQSAFAADVNTIRLYGEDDVSTPNFPYMTAEGPFDPLSYEAPIKDFMTFNPAIMDDGIVVNHANAYEKVFARQYFVPNYREPTGRVWLDEGDFVRYSNDIVTEYTYMFVSKVDYQPIEGTAMDPQNSAYWTKFWFPIADNDDSQIGLDGMDANGDGIDDMVHLEAVGDFDVLDNNGDGYKDVKIATDSFQLSTSDASMNTLQFLDHMVVVKDVAVSGLNGNPLITIVMDVYYTGNDNPELIHQNYQASIIPGDYLVASRHVVADSMEPDFDYSWFLRADAASTNYVYVTVGRRLYQGETFFVDGAEYDVAAIFGSVDEGDWRYDNTVKYITIRNPIPEDFDVDLGDLTVVKESVSANELIPMLPPFNKDYTMIDDIDLPFYDQEADWHTYTCYDADFSNPVARMLDAEAMEIYFVDEGYEERFDTNLLEILDEDERYEDWQWLDILTLPYQYKEFVYPERPDVDGSYADFIFTSSFEAPYTRFCQNPSNTCWSMEGLDKRLMFEYDQERGIEDIYVNEIDAQTNGLRLYGGSADVADLMSATFPYSADNPEGPFDPLNDEAPEMDFVTMNPSLLTGTVVNNANAYEKVFIRQWFDPDYHEPAGDVWLDESYDYQRVTDDVVTEYTYMLLSKNYMPIEGTALDPQDADFILDHVATGAHWTKFWFPVADNDDTQIGIDGMDVNGDGLDDMTILKSVADFNDDGRTDIAISSESFQLQTGVQNANGNSDIQFLDHRVVVKDVALAGANSNPLISLTMDIYYTGNDEDELIEQNYQASIVPGGAICAGRHFAIVNHPGIFDYPWFITADAASDNYVYVTVGRILHTGETFFVDGAEYDVAMIYGSTFEDGDDGGVNSTVVNTFKYITIRNPIPEENEVDLGDLTIVKEPVQPMETIPLLPPFNGDYRFIDDIDVDLYDAYETCYFDDDTPIGSRISPVHPALDIYYTTAPEVEDRFHSNIFELLCEGTVLASAADEIEQYPVWESWKWLHIRTLPDEYKEFVYPDVWDYYGLGDYLVTSSFTAPNSELCYEDFEEDYRSADVQRLMFYHDPANGVGLYMNQADGVVFTGADETKGDFNDDGVIDLKDLSAFALAYNSSSSDANYDACADFNDDGLVDLKDLSAFALVYNK